MFEQLHPLVPVPLIDLLRVEPLLMIEGLLCNVDDLVEQTSAKFRVVLRLRGALVRLGFSISAHTLLNESLCGFAHRLKHGLLLLLSQLVVQLATLFVLLLPQLSILHNDVFALLCAPHFIVQLLFLVRLPFDKLNNDRLSLFEVQFA